MAINLKCTCGVKLAAPDKYAGKRIKCPKCASVIPVPDIPTAAVVVEDDPLALPPTQQIPPQQMPPQQYQQPYAGQPPHPGQPMAPGQQPQYMQPQQGYAPAPGTAWGNQKPAKPKKKSNPILLASVIGGIVLLAAAGIGIFYMMEMSNASESAVVKNNAGTPGAMINNERSLPRQQEVRQIPPSKPNTFDSGKTFNEMVTSGTTDNMMREDLVTTVDPSIAVLTVTSEDGEGSIGSGFFVGDDGLIVTNYHVIQGAEKVEVETKDGGKAMAIGYLHAVAGKDLAVIQVDPADLDCVGISATLEPVRSGESVAAFGAPMFFKFTASDGTISGVRSGSEISEVFKISSRGQDVYKMLGYSVDTDWIQTTAAISGGNSGGPLVNMKGELIGVNTWQNPDGQNLNFASTVEHVEEIVNDRGDEIHPFVKLPNKIATRFGR